MTTTTWVCRGCGCTDTSACMTEDGPCRWIEEDLCSGCVATHQQPAPPIFLAINGDHWKPLPEDVLPIDQFGGGVTHDIYSATVYVSIERGSASIGRELPALVAIPQANLTQAANNVASIEKLLRKLRDDQAQVRANIGNELTHILQLLGVQS